MLRTIFFTALTALVFATPQGAHGEDAAPITQYDGLIWTGVQANGRTLHFVVDTGAASSCLNLKTAHTLGLQLGSPLEVAGVGGNARGYWCNNFQASIAGMPLPAKVAALDLSGPARACSQPIDGLIGADFFRGKVMQLDYARGTLAKVTAAPNGVKTRFANGVICVPVSLNGTPPRWTRLDTGCTDALDWCPTSTSKTTPTKSIALATTKTAGTLADITIGSINLHALPVRIHTTQFFPGEAGLLGNAALSRTRLTIDGIAGRVSLENPTR